MSDRRLRFEALALPHLDAAYDLARWLSRSPADADDIVQDAMLRAFRAFDGFRGDNIKPWLLAIVRNCWRNRAGDVRRRGHVELTAEAPAAGPPLFVQISDTHIGFNKAANPDVAATLARAIGQVNAMPAQPAFALHTGDISHLSRPAEFDQAAGLLSTLRVSELHTTPGEHDVADGTGEAYFARYGAASGNRGYYSFDHAGVHFAGLVNVMHFKAGGLASLADSTLA